MAINKLKVMLSFMREISEGNKPSENDYDLTQIEMANIIEACQEEGLITGVQFLATGGYETKPFFLDEVRLTVKGMEYLNNNSPAMKTYKGLKQIREWLPF